MVRYVDPVRLMRRLTGTAYKGAGLMPTIRRTATRDAITVLIRGWKIVVGVPVTFGLIAMLACSLQKPVYEATATLYITSGANGPAGPSLPYEWLMGAAGRVTSYAKLVYSDEVMTRAVKDSGLNMTVAEARTAARSGTVPESEMLTVSARHQDPEVAQRLTSALANSMVKTVAMIEMPNGGGAPTSRLTIVTPATINPAPVSPATSMDVTLATIIGLLVGVAGVLTRERLNNTVRDERDVENIFGARPLPCIPHDEVLAAAQIIDFGAPATAAAGAFRHLRTALSVAHSPHPLATIMVTSPRDGEGKSTVALNLAAAFAEGGSTVVVVDAHVRNPAVATRTGNCEGPGLADAIRSQIPLLQPSAIDNLKVISAGNMSDDDLTDLLASRGCGIFFEHLVKSFDYVIVDSPPLFDGPEAEATARWADGVLLVASRGRSKISDCYRSLEQLSSIGTELVGVVLNDVRPQPAPAYRSRRNRLAGSTGATTHRNRSRSPSPKSPAAKIREQKH